MQSDTWGLTFGGGDMQAVSICDDLSPLVGMGVEGYFHHDGYSHTFVALQTSSDSEIVISTDGHDIVKYFEVFPIRFDLKAKQDRTWAPLPVPLVIARADSLWRSEWIEPVEDNGQFLGSGPHNVQCFGRGPVPQRAEHAVRVLAGIWLGDTSGRGIVLSASASPFRADIEVDPSAASRLLEDFESIA